MGCFFSKKTTSSSPPCVLPSPSDLTKSNTESEKKKSEEETVKNGIFIIKHRKSHDIERCSEEEKGKVDQKLTSTTTTTTTTSNSTNTSNFTSESAVDVSNNGGNSCSNGVNGGLGSGGVVVRTSSCTKEEVDAILIQCGRLSRSSSSTGKAALSCSGDSESNSRGGRKYSGSKRSYDFDHETQKSSAIEDNIDDCNVGGSGGDEAVAEAERIHRHRQRQRQSRASPSSSQRRRRTPSRERDQQQQQRSGSRERGGNGGSSGGGGSRRLSKSPGRRSESPIPNSGSANASASGSSNRPGKMVSVPATVSSLAMDKSNNGTNGTEAPPSSAAVKRNSAKRNAGDTVAMGSRTVSSPRSRSPARANNVRVSNENQNAHSNQLQPLSLSRSNSRKAEHSPYRRNPLSEIDQNSLGFEQLPLPNNKITSNNSVLSQNPIQKPNVDNASNNKVFQGTDNKNSTGKGALENKVTAENCRAKEQQKLIVEEAKGLQPMTKDSTVAEVASETLKQVQTLTRSRSSRRSRDLDIKDPELLLNPNPSYTSLLLEDIQNFHQKTTTTTSFSLPACVTKACSILEAVADLNSSTSSNLSDVFSDDKRCPAAEQFNKKRLEIKDPIVESEVGVTDDLMEPSLHKYITVRSTIGGADMEEQESSGSNSFVGGQQHWLASSSWEPNSADSNDCSTSSRFFAAEDDRSPLGGVQRHVSKSGRDTDPTHRRLITKQQSGGIGRGKVGSVRGAAST